MILAGVLAASEGRIPEAERFFKVVLSQDANSASAWSNLANVHLSEGQALRALEEFTRAISLAPNVRTTPSYLCLLCNLLFNLLAPFTSEVLHLSIL